MQPIKLKDGDLELYPTEEVLKTKLQILKRRRDSMLSSWSDPNTIDVFIDQIIYIENQITKIEKVIKLYKK